MFALVDGQRKSLMSYLTTIHLRQVLFPGDRDVEEEKIANILSRLLGSSEKGIDLYGRCLYAAS